MPTRDREYFNAAWRRWYERNKQRKLEWGTRRRNELRAWWSTFKATKRCSRCNESAPECLHFHHTDPATKEFDISIAASQGWSRKRILVEVAKCEVLCANCHLIHHWNQRRK